MRPRGAGDLIGEREGFFDMEFLRFNIVIHSAAYVVELENELFRSSIFYSKRILDSAIFDCYDTAIR